MYSLWLVVLCLCMCVRRGEGGGGGVDSLKHTRSFLTSSPKSKFENDKLKPE